MQSEVTVGEGLPTASEFDTFENVTVFDRLSSNGCCSIEIEYPEELSSAKQRKNYKDRVLRESPETLIANYSTVDNCRVKCNLLLYTEHPSAWHSALCSTYCNIRKGGIGRGRQLTVFEDSDADSVMLTVNVYNNGTVMVQGRESSLDLFEHSFPALRERVERAKTIPELANPQPLPPPPAQRSRQPPRPQHSPVTDSPRQVSNIRALKECLSVLELQFTEFREHTEHKLATLSQTSPSEQLRDEVHRLKTEHRAEVQELRAAMRGLEEDNQAMKTELRRLREELTRTAQHRELRSLQRELEGLRGSQLRTPAAQEQQRWIRLYSERGSSSRREPSPPRQWRNVLPLQNPPLPRKRNLNLIREGLQDASKLQTRHQRGDTYHLSLDEILDETKLLDIGLKQKQWLMSEALASNPKIEVKEGKYAFKPRYHLKDKKALLRLLDKHDQLGLGGILLDDIEEGLPNAQKAIKALGDQIIFISRPDKKKILFYNDKHCQFVVDEEFQKLWRSIPVDSMDEEKIEDYLKRQGISSMQETGPKKMIPMPKRKKSASLKKRRFKTHNDHLAGVLEDYSEGVPTKK
ncbi:General transcription factor IIE subunit 2 [Acipenser ruthenus]|uniref:General transcription factor IIE subunit 2 n=1 Tax=Acipenser ruthenus TaxID=7906 RepID=A0A444TVW4_ACIRT|nr:General transcription factor IIE subunit 2 [Acipenser ruthenus]